MTSSRHDPKCVLQSVLPGGIVGFGWLGPIDIGPLGGGGGISGWICWL